MHIFSYITMIAKHLTYTFILICFQLTLIYCPYLCFALCLPSDQWFSNLYCTNNNIIAKYIVLSNIISVVSDNICVFVFKNPSWYQKNIVLLHTLSAYNSLLVRYKVYLSDPRECLCKSWRYAETYEKPLLLGENYTEIKAWQLKFA